MVLPKGLDSQTSLQPLKLSMLLRRQMELYFVGKISNASLMTKQEQLRNKHYGLSGSEISINPSLTLSSKAIFRLLLFNDLLRRSDCFCTAIWKDPFSDNCSRRACGEARIGHGAGEG